MSYGAVWNDNFNWENHIFPSKFDQLIIEIRKSNFNLSDILHLPQHHLNLKYLCFKTAKKINLNEVRAFLMNYFQDRRVVFSTQEYFYCQYWPLNFLPKNIRANKLYLFNPLGKMNAPDELKDKTVVLYGLYYHKNIIDAIISLSTIISGLECANIDFRHLLNGTIFSKLCALHFFKNFPDLNNSEMLLSANAFPRLRYFSRQEPVCWSITDNNLFVKANFIWKIGKCREYAKKMLTSMRCLFIFAFKKILKHDITRMICKMLTIADVSSGKDFDEYLDNCSLLSNGITKYQYEEGKVIYDKLREAQKDLSLVKMNLTNYNLRPKRARSEQDKEAVEKLNLTYEELFKKEKQCKRALKKLKIKLNK